MNTEKLKKMLAAKLEQKKTLDARMIESDSKEERAAIGETLAALAAEIKDCEELLSEMNEPAEPNDTGAASAGKEKPGCADTSFFQLCCNAYERFAEA